MKNTRFLTKILLLVLTVAMAVSLFAINGFAAEEERPCYHQRYELLNSKTVVESGKPYAVGKCSGCNEELKLALNSLLTEYSDSTYLNSTFLAGGTAETTNYKYLMASKETIGPSAAPYTIEYDVEVVAIDESKIKNGQSLMDAYTSNPTQMHILRAFAVPNETTADTADYYSDRAYLRANGSATSTYVATIIEGNSYHFKLDVNPSTGDIRFEGYNLATPTEVFEATYTNSKLGASATQYYFRFNAIVGSLNFSNFAFYDGVVEDTSHVHTDKWCTLDELSASVTDTTIETAYKCYCGESISRNDGITKLIKDNLIDSYEWSAEFDGMPTEGEYFIAFDYNVRNAISVSSDIIKLGDTVIYGADGFDKATTFNCAVKVEYTGEGVIDYTVYVDGVAVDSEKGVALAGDASVLTLGDADAPQTDENAVNVRFNKLKIAEVGEGEVVTPTFKPNDLRPCFHAEMTNDAKLELADGKLVCSYVCPKCGEKLSVAKSGKDLYDASLNKADNDFKLGSNRSITMSGATHLRTTEDVIGGSADPFWLAFDLTVNSVNPSQITDYDAGKGMLCFSASYRNFLRAYCVKGNGTELATSANDVSTTKIAIGYDRSVVTYLEKGDVLSVAMYCQPTAKSVDIYINGEYKVTKEGAFNNYNSSYSFIRFMETAWADLTLDNFVFAKENTAADEAHTHTDKWCSMREKGVDMTEDSFKPYYVCYCGEKQYYGEISKIVENNLPTVYSGTNTVEADSLDGVWFATDINIRETDVANGALIKRGEQTLLAVKDGAIVYADGSTMEPIDHRTTLSIAIKFVGETAYELYCDGEWVSSQANADGDTSATITFGDEAFGENVRFYCNRLVEIGETATDEVVTYLVDETVRPHYHGNATTLYNMQIVAENENGLAYKSFICGDCGERAKIGLNNLLKPSGESKYINSALIADGTFNITGFVQLEASKDTIGIDAAPYTVEYDVEIVSINESKITGGKCFMDAYRGSAQQQHILRAFAVPDETTADTADYYSDRAYLRSDASETSTVVATIMEGNSYHFKLNINPSTGEIRFEGYNLATPTEVFEVTYNTVKLNNSDDPFYFRFNDNVGSFKLSNFAFYNEETSGDIYHTHSDAWLTDSENAATSIVFTEDNKFAYSYECYCGQTVTYGISEAIKEEILPVYGITEETVIIPELEAPESDFWFVGNIRARELSTEDGKALVTIGEEVLLGINSDGEFTVDGEGTGAKLEADGEYHSLAFRFDVSLNEYTVYFDGAYVTDATYDSIAGDVNIGSAEAGVYHFDSAAVVVLSEDGDIAYKVAEDAHTHHYNPETSSLEFNAERSAITINYTCVECDRPAVDGISENLYDEDNEEMILPVFGVEEKVVESPLLTTAAPYWFSFDAVLKSELKQGRGLIFKFVDEENEEIGILNLYTDGTLKDADGNSVATLGATATNVTINVVKNDGEYSYRLYIDGIYCGEYAIELDGEKSYAIALGADFATTLEITEIKFAKMANGGTLEIGTFICNDDEHVNVINKTTKIEYVYVNEFKLTYRCARCGKTTTEQITASYYEATPHVYTACGDMNAVKTGEKGDSYWIVADINVRGYIGNFKGYVPLISDGGVAALLINNNGELMLADGTKIYRALKPTSTYNVALKYADGAYSLFLDGEYVGCTTGESFKEGIHSENSYEYFGSPELKNIRYYNIKSIVTGVTDEPMSVEFIEDPSVLPCVHAHHSFNDVEIILDEQIKEIYICYKCGERVVIVNNKDIFDYESNPTIIDGAFRATNYKAIATSEEYMSREGVPYWVKFTVHFEKLNSELLHTQKKDSGGALFDNGGSGHNILRMFSVEENDGSFRDGAVEIRNSWSRGSQLIATVYEGETHEFVIGVIPSNGRTIVYMDGEYVLTSNSAGSFATGASSYVLRFLDGAWGTFNVSNFEIISSEDGKHVHTAAYAQYIEGGYDVLAYTDATLTHRYTCYCGAEVVEGIEKIFVDPIGNVSGATAFTEINGGEELNMGVEPYWFSAKVTTSGASNVYSYGEDVRMVEVDNDGYFVVDGVTTNLSASADYDVVSVNVFPLTGKYDVYVNGSYLASGKAGFAPKENFNILLGGEGSQVSYKNLKLVRLVDGAEGCVVDCSNHDISNTRQMLKKVVLDDNNIVTGIEYTCALDCGYKVTSSVSYSKDLYDASLNTANNDFILDSNGSITMNGVKYLRTTEDVIGVNAAPFWITLDLNVNDVFPSKINDTADNYTDGDGLLCFSTAYRTFLRAYRVKANGNGIATDPSDVSSTKIAVGYEGKVLGYLEKGDSFSVAIYCRPIDKSAEVYVNGELKLIKEKAFSSYDSNNSFIRFMETGWANLTLNKFGIYRANIGDLVYPPEPEKVKPHFPETKNPGTLTYENGNIVHEFTCACGCKKDIKLQSFVSLQNPELNGGKTVTELLNVTKATPVYVDEKLMAGSAMPYYLAFELTVDDLNVSGVKADDTNGSPIINLYRVDVNGNEGNRRILRAYYEDGKVYLGNNVSSEKDKIRVEMVEGESYNIAMAIDPTNQRIVLSVDEQTVDYDFGQIAAGHPTYYIRFTGDNINQYDFTNIKIGYLTDACAHIGEAKTCLEASGKTTDCGKCGSKVLLIHNYVETLDRSGKWIKNECQDCGEYFIEFRDKSLIDKSFATELLLIDYLTKTYPPMFITIPE